MFQALALLTLLAGGAQDPVIDVSPEYARTYEVQAISPRSWPEGCRVRWTLSRDGAFVAEAGRHVATGRWRVETWGPSPGPRSRTVLLLEGLVENEEAVCGIAPPSGQARLDLMSLRDGTLFIVSRRTNAEGVTSTSPQARLQPEPRTSDLPPS